MKEAAKIEFLLCFYVPVLRTIFAARSIHIQLLNSACPIQAIFLAPYKSKTKTKKKALPMGQALSSVFRIFCDILQLAVQD